MQASFTLLSSSSCLLSGLSGAIAPCPVQPACAVLFPDVPSDYKFYNEIMSLASLNVVAGYADNTFRPEKTMTREAALKTLVQAFDIPLDVTSPQHFSDVPPVSPYFVYVEAAYKAGLISGYSDGTFRPEEAITRGALVKMVVQAAGWAVVKPAKPTLGDVDANSPFYPYVETAAAHAILDNIAVARGSFEPGKAATRGESAAMIARSMSSAGPALPPEVEAQLKKTLQGGVQK
jgi:S-layer homology domain